tara:strand:- start:926 stop:1159 length:234 start_codon:yes stop_codon:yes gene_type:complete
MTVVSKGVLHNNAETVSECVMFSFSRLKRFFGKHRLFISLLIYRTNQYGAFFKNVLGRSSIFEKISHKKVIDVDLFN